MKYQWEEPGKLSLGNAERVTNTMDTVSDTAEDKCVPAQEEVEKKRKNKNKKKPVKTSKNSKKSRKPARRG